MITKQKIRDGIADGIVTFVTDPNMESGTVCKIGDFWFYFGGFTAEECSSASYLKNVPLDDVVDEVFAALEDFRHDKMLEYEYYDVLLNKREV